MIGILRLKIFQGENLGVVQGKGAAAKILASSPPHNPIFFQDAPAYSSHFSWKNLTFYLPWDLG